MGNEYNWMDASYHWVEVSMLWAMLEQDEELVDKLLRLYKPEDLLRLSSALALLSNKMENRALSEHTKHPTA